MTFQWWFKSSRLQLLSVTRKQKQNKKKRKNPPSKDRLSLLRGSTMSGAVPSLHYGSGLKRGQQEERTYTFLHRSWINEQYRKRGEGYSCGTNFGTRNKGLLTFFQGQTASPDRKKKHKCSAFESCREKSTFFYRQWAEIPAAHIFCEFSAVDTLSKWSPGQLLRAHLCYCWSELLLAIHVPGRSWGTVTGRGEIGKDNYCMSTRSLVLYVCGNERAQIAHEHFDANRACLLTVAHVRVPWLNGASYKMYLI